jgi:hypothetical protein
MMAFEIALITLEENTSMSVFKIQIHKQPGPVAPTSVSPTLEAKTPGDPKPEEGATAATDEVREILEPPSLKPVEGPVSDKKEEEGVIKPKPADKMVRVDGPVGRIFTQALNQLLATEGYQTMIDFNEIAEVEENEDKAADRDTHPVEVHCYEADKLNNVEITQLLNRVTRHTDRPFVIAVESSKGFSRSVRVLEAMREIPNITICYTQAAALRAVRSLIE